jgi:hypothetical protein
LADVSYKVEIELSTKGNLASKLDGLSNKADALDGLFSKVGGAASKIGDAFEGAVEKAASLAATMAKLGGAAALGAMAYGVVGINNEIEKTQIGLAAIFNANGISNFAGGMSIAAEQMRKMRADAAALPGEARDLFGIFKMVSVPGFQAGGSVDELRKLSGSAMAAGSVMGLPMEQVARETAMLLQGRAGGHNVLGMDLGIGAHGFNEKSAAERLKIVTAELAKFEPAIEAFKTSFEGVSSTLRDNAKLLLGTATLPLFNRIKVTFGEANKYLDDNKTKLDEMADGAGRKLARGFDYALDTIRAWYPAVEAFAFNAEHRIAEIWTRFEPTLGRLGEAGKHFLEDPASLDKIAHVLDLYAAVKVGRSALGMAGGLGGVASFLGVGGGAAAGAAEIGGSSAAAGAAEGAFAALGAALLPLGVLAGLVAGAINVLSDETSAWHDDAVVLWNTTKSELTEALEHLGGAWQAIRPLAMSLGDLFGTTLLAAIAGASTGIELLAKGVEGLAGAMADAAGVVSTAQAGIGSKITSLLLKQSDKAIRFSVKRPADEGKAKPRTGGGGGGGGTHIQKVEIVITANTDPSRIARLVYADLANLARHRTTSPDVRNFSASRP